MPIFYCCGATHPQAPMPPVIITLGENFLLRLYSCHNIASEFNIFSIPQLQGSMPPNPTPIQGNEIQFNARSEST